MELLKMSTKCKIELTPSELQILTDMYFSGKTFDDISKTLGYCYEVIKRARVQLNLPPRPKINNNRRKYPINEDFFDLIDTQEKAYILGFLYADGCNYQHQTKVKIALQERDKHILEEMRDLINPTKPLHYYETKSVNQQNVYSLVFSSKHMSDRLTELGCMPRKTHKLKFPTEDQVPDYLIHHFVRGYFDGDGYISKSKKYPLFTIMGNMEFISQLQQKFIDQLEFGKTKLRKDNSPNIVTLSYSGRRQVIKFRDWIYQDVSLCLYRKRQIFNLL